MLISLFILLVIFNNRSLGVRERSLNIEQKETEDFAKICGKISGPNILAYENPILRYDRLSLVSSKNASITTR